MGTQKNHLDEAVLLSTQNMFKLMGKKIITILHLKNCLTGPMVLGMLLLENVLLLGWIQLFRKRSLFCR